MTGEGRGVGGREAKLCTAGVKQGAAEAFRIRLALHITSPGKPLLASPPPPIARGLPSYRVSAADGTLVRRFQLVTTVTSRYSHCDSLVSFSPRAHAVGSLHPGAGPGTGLVQAQEVPAPGMELCLSAGCPSPTLRRQHRGFSSPFPPGSVTPCGPRGGQVLMCSPVHSHHTDGF